jgi:asparagine synthase (glutamine-hydrolysing)
MCGIAGFYGFREDELIKQISVDMLHRGPDGEGLFIEDKISLLNRRLAIIDVAGGDQPIYNEDKSVVVVYNGEIYNYQELRAELEKAGHSFTTHSDTEVIVHGYEQWGDTCFEKFNGMFGVALYDKKTKKLILARDHFGIKPLYFSLLPNKSIIFASEIKPILNSKLVEKKVNERILYRYLNFRIHDDQAETFFEGINRLLPGQIMIVSPDKIEKKQFSHLKKELLEMKEQPFAEKDIDTFKIKLIEAIKMRLISEVPVGTCLSGGLDSSTVVAVVNKLLDEKTKEAQSVGDKQNSFSAVFPNSTNDEEAYIDALLADHKDIASHKITPKPEEFFTEIEDFVRTQEEPTISTGPYAQFKVMQEAHKFVTVVLDGQGADEMMAGYLPYYFVYLKELMKKNQIGTLISEISSSSDVLSKFFTHKLMRKVGLKKDIPVKSLLNQKFIQSFSSESFSVTPDNLKKRLVEDIFHNSLPSLLRYEDKNAMRFSIEGRVPFLDFNLIRFLFSLSNEAIIKQGWNKNILRQAVKSLLPEKISQRRNKIGFTTPEHEWFLRMKNRIYGMFLTESFANRPYFNQAAVLKAFQLFIEGKTDDSMLFWRILNVELWLQVFFDEKKVEVKKEKGFFDPNEGKNVEIKVGDKTFDRYVVKTDLFQKGDDYAKKITSHVTNFFSQLAKNEQLKQKYSGKKWLVVVSEKVVAISQGRAFFIWDINPSIWAKVLSNFVTRTPYGIGLGSPWTMQLAINEIGLPRVLFASLVAVVTKPFGVKGIFYNIVGREVASIDGPTEYSLYPSNVSAKLGPVKPHEAAKSIADTVRKTLTDTKKELFVGAAIIDSNDIGRTLLGNGTNLDSKHIEDIFKDNPMGQANEQTPMVVVYEMG